jgi:regulator of replication initiation timing
MDLHAELVFIRQNLERLVRQNKQLTADNNDLRVKLQQLQSQKQAMEQDIEVLESQKKILKIAKGLESNPKAKQEAKLKVNEFIKEIDKCIALLQD